uniref:Ycf80 n=1 Tax=Caloglossa beccarii TaxID=131038 RepID=A0A1Z1M8F3_9FLOR|nr:hypothetical protein [Caloglossa beccarii]ARW62249.1 hypothetical protein [Caloglossa beccarii]
MILFHMTLKNYYKQFNNLNSMLFKLNCSNKQHIFRSTKSNSSILIAKQNSKINLASSYLLKKKINYRFISRKFWQKFINQYWQETLFISTNNILSDYYTNKLKSSGLLLYKGNQYKKFLSHFSKDLISGKVQVSFRQNNINLPLVYVNNDKYIKYIWRKGLNWYIYNFFSRYSFIKNYLLKDKSIPLMKKVEINIVPLFAIVNQNNQLIVAESSNKIATYKYLFGPLKNLYEKLVEKQNYVGLLFINPHDALEYKKYSISKYLFLYNSSLNLFISKLSLYYKLLYSSLYNTDFRLIPDLKEVSNMIYKYQYYKNVQLDTSQKYGRTYFQGQPIYRIRPVQVINLHTGYKSELDYFYNFNKNKSSVRCHVIFLNYKTALLAWNKFKKDYPHYKMSSNPPIYVSNLENFLKLKVEKNHIPHIIIPSLETYNLLFSQISLNSSWSIAKILQSWILYVKNLCQRLIWSLISRNPII